MNEIESSILKTLKRSMLTSNDLTYAIKQPPDQTVKAVNSLWQRGFIDDLSAPLLYVLLPALRSQKYRNIPPGADVYLALTVKAYFSSYCEVL
jgi:hypothetical protein